MVDYKRIIPCLDIKDGRVVKGVNFKELKDAADPVAAAEYYSNANADELVFLDIMATYENRATILDLIKQTAALVTIPFTVGGGISALAHIDTVLSAGADKISINTAAAIKPSLISEAAKRFGSERVVVAIDVKKSGNGYTVVINGGHTDMKTDAVEWAKQVASLGAGEILLTSMDRDGTKDGYDIEITKQITNAVNIPVIASGGAGNKEHFYEAFAQGGAQAALAASLFHFRELEILNLKNYLKEKDIDVRIW